MQRDAREAISGWATRFPTMEVRQDCVPDQPIARCRYPGCAMPRQARKRKKGFIREFRDRKNGSGGAGSEARKGRKCLKHSSLRPLKAPPSAALGRTSLNRPASSPPTPVRRNPLPSRSRIRGLHENASRNSRMNQKKCCKQGRLSASSGVVGRGLSVVASHLLKCGKKPPRSRKYVRS